MKQDPTSLSNGTEVTLKHASIVWNANFNEKMLEGQVVLALEIAPNCKKVVLDSRKLKIYKVVLDSCELDFKFGDEHTAFGVAVQISLPESIVKSDPQKINLEISYETGKGDECTALQWLPIEQTKDQKHPFLFSQCQAIHARSLFPCLDYPAQKFTYDAKLTVPKICTGLMSAISTGSHADETSTTFTFEQKNPYP